MQQLFVWVLLRTPIQFINLFQLDSYDDDDAVEYTALDYAAVKYAAFDDDAVGISSFDDLAFE